MYMYPSAHPHLLYAIVFIYNTLGTTAIVYVAPEHFFSSLSQICFELLLFSFRLLNTTPLQTQKIVHPLV